MILLPKWDSNQYISWSWRWYSISEVSYERAGFSPHSAKGLTPKILKISCLKQRFKHCFHGNSEIYQFHEVSPRGIIWASCKEYIHAIIFSLVPRDHEAFQFENTLTPPFAYRAVQLLSKNYNLAWTTFLSILTKMLWILQSFWGAVSFDRNIGESWNLKCIILITFFIQISNKNGEKQSQIENWKSFRHPRSTRSITYKDNYYYCYSPIVCYGCCASLTPS